MCFSSEASFVTGTVLVGTGILSLKIVPEKKYIVFAGIPVLFGIQQLIEGILWLSFTHSEYQGLKILSTYAFLLFAQVIWPVWVPLSVLLMEKNEKRKKILRAFLWIGIVLAAYLGYCLLNYEVYANVGEHHIHYSLLFPTQFKWLSGLFYFFPTTISPFISSAKKNWIIGGLLILSHVISKIFFHDYLISVWCFMAALISLIVIAEIRSLMQTPSTGNSHLKD
jgi:hypothetical protein